MEGAGHQNPRSSEGLGPACPMGSVCLAGVSPVWGRLMSWFLERAETM